MYTQMQVYPNVFVYTPTLLSTLMHTHRGWGVLLRRTLRMDTYEGSYNRYMVVPHCDMYTNSISADFVGSFVRKRALLHSQTFGKRVRCL